jgi:peptidoglycan/xylan/chitin deacetylase (PgdA/CDA1 family)
MPVREALVTGRSSMLKASKRIGILEAHRVPYEIVGSDRRLTRLERGDGGPGLYWPGQAAGEPGAYRLGQTPLFTRVLPSGESDALLRGTGTDWRRELEIVDSAGRAVAAVLHARDGSVFLPFDPDEASATLLREAYLETTSSAVSRKTSAVARAAYYRARPLLPRDLQLALRRRFVRIQERSAFPRWPSEPALHDLYYFMLELVDEIAAEPVPRLASWPDGKSWALVLTHDVETADGYELIDAVLEVERRHGVRSAWYLVPERDYSVADERVKMLTAEGCEVGLHGLCHDGRDLSPDEIPRRLPAMQRWAERWGARGFRAPATQRQWDLMPQLGFDYDSSYSDSARYEPQAGGSCSWLPFLIDELVELPITLPMDHTVFELLGNADAAVWHEKAALLRDRGGMALLLTHPDYLDDLRLREYDRFLRTFAHDDSVWVALPREVSSWWRRRAASRIVREGDEWVVEGEAAGSARIQFGATSSS